MLELAGADVITDANSKSDEEILERWQASARDHLVAMEEQYRQERSLFCSSQSDYPLLLASFQWAEVVAGEVSVAPQEVVSHSGAAGRARFATAASRCQVEGASAAAA